MSKINMPDNKIHPLIDLENLEHLTEDCAEILGFYLAEWKKEFQNIEEHETEDFIIDVNRKLSCNFNINLVNSIFTKDKFEIEILQSDRIFKIFEKNGEFVYEFVDWMDKFQFFL